MKHRKYPQKKKKCVQCGEIKSFKLFYQDIQKPDGLMYHCRDCHRARYLRSYKKRKKAITEYANQYYQEHKEEEGLKARARYREAKKELTKTLGDVCKRCGFSDPRVLQIDHINGGGRKHLKKKGSGYTMYREMAESVKNNEGKYQLLCANCNLIEAFEKGYKTSIWT